MKDKNDDVIQQRLEEAFESELRHDTETRILYWANLALYYFCMGLVPYAFFHAARWLSLEWGYDEPGLLPYFCVLLGAVVAARLQYRPQHSQCWKVLSNALFEADLETHEGEFDDEPWCGIVVNAKVFRLLSWNPVTRRVSGARVYINVWAVDPTDNSAHLIFSESLEACVGSPKSLLENPYMMGWSEEVRGLDPDRKYILKLEARNEDPVFARLIPFK